MGKQDWLWGVAQLTGLLQGHSLVSLEMCMDNGWHILPAAPHEYCHYTVILEGLSSSSDVKQNLRQKTLNKAKRSD